MQVASTTDYYQTKSVAEKILKQLESDKLLTKASLEQTTTTTTSQSLCHQKLELLSKAAISGEKWALDGK